MSALPGRPSSPCPDRAVRRAAGVLRPGAAPAVTPNVTTTSPGAQ
jgi:hypothetical protein